MLQYDFLLKILGLLSVTSGQIHNITPGRKKASEMACQNVASEPYFDIFYVLDFPWRIYYTWNMKLDNNVCIDVHFQKATPQIIKRIYNDMNRYLAEQPDWGAALLLMTVGRKRQEMLLIPDKQLDGRFTVVHNYNKAALSGIMLPLLKFQLKLFSHGKFLFFMDCHSGIASFAMRFDEPLYRAELITAAQEIFPLLGEGDASCLNSGNADQFVLLPEKNTTPKLGYGPSPAIKV